MKKASKQGRNLMVAYWQACWIPHPSTADQPSCMTQCKRWLQPVGLARFVQSVASWTMRKKNIYY